MGDYNPHAPYILGNEWVAIRQADFTPDNAITERGYIMSIDNEATIVTGSFYVAEPPLLPVVGANELIAVYPVDTLDQTGPIRTVVIPVTNVTTTGAGIFATAARLNNPSDVSHCSIAATSSGQGFSMSFDVSSYTAMLDNKRILDVGLEYIAAGPTTVMANINVELARAADVDNAERYTDGLQGPVNISTNTEVQYVSLSELNSFWTTGVTVQSEPRAYPWRYEELNLFSASATPANNRLVLTFASFSDESNDDVVISYAALRVTYCEEKRVAYGAVNIMGFTTEYVTGYNYVMLRDPSFNIGATLPAGEYAVTTTHVNRNPTITDLVAASAPKLSALQELYELPYLTGVQVNRTLVTDQTFTAQYSDVIPPIGLHTTSFIVSGSHMYGTQIAAPVYSGISVTQQLETSVAPSASASYTQIRFYARRFGNTVSDLTVTMTNFPGATASLSVVEFDALSEIIDGWKEVTLSLETPAVVSVMGVEPIVWSANGTASQQWQILGERTTINQPDNSTQDGDRTTYRSSLGAVAILTWKSPNVSVSTDDAYADVAFILSQDPPLVSGFGISLMYQEVATVGLNCGVPNGCIPTGIAYNELTWDNQITLDSFNRTMVTGFGSTDTGETYTLTTSAADYSVTGGVGRMSWTTDATERSALLDTGYVDHTISIDFALPSLLSVGVMELFMFTRYTDASNTHSFYIFITATGVVTYSMYRTIGGVSTLIANGSVSITYTPDLWLRMTVTSTADQHSFTIAPQYAGEFTDPIINISVIDTSIPTGTIVGFGGYVQSGSSFSATPFYAYVDNLQINRASLNGVTQEIQRLDAYDTDWQTIMRSTDITTQSFADYEARVGVNTDYRIRTRNVLDFAGVWVTGSGTIPTPGVQITSDGNSVLIFTTNVGPTGNLAYTMVWDSRPIESFVFPEADTVQLQRMFGKNFMTAFRPLERGGERFQRTILVNAAAIALPSLANFRSLRDLAWADVPYVCVRDELGNRWFATVIVPSGDVQVNRQLYLAQIDVVENSETPYAVGPA